MKRILVSIVLLLGVLMLPAAAHAQNINGDVNGDGAVNITDVNAVIDIILGSGYNISADVNNDGGINIADVNAILGAILSGNVQPVPDFVNLGLPSGTLWASRNVGASVPEDYGDYFAWGETEPKSKYNWNTYKWCIDNYNTLTKYCTLSNYGYNGFTDGRTELKQADDAAWTHYLRGRIPSEDQIYELRNQCTWEWTKKNGVKGMLVTGPNGNSIFLPAAGSDSNVGVEGFYWSRTLCAGAPYGTFFLRFNSGGVVWDDWCRLRYRGTSVRAVRASQN